MCINVWLQEKYEEHLSQEHRDLYFAYMRGEAIDGYPGQPGAIIKNLDGLLTAEMANWGLQPAWSKDPKFGRESTYNARAETVRKLPSFADAFPKRRCIVPATYFREQYKGRWWKVAPVDARTMGFAGLYEPPTPVAPEQTYTIITSPPNIEMTQVQDRMPVILAEEDWEAWLNPKANLDEIYKLLRPAADGFLRVTDDGRISKKPEQFSLLGDFED